MSSAPARPSAAPSLSATLRTVYAGLREDLEVSRHVFRGEASYVVRDPMTFQSQRLALADYDVFVALNAGRCLDETFQDLCRRGRLTPKDEETFYEFVVRLHRLGFLRLPLSDDKLLYRRFRLRERSKLRAKLSGFLFYRVPVWNPNTFLDRTIEGFRFLFQPWFFAVWLLVMGAAGVVAAARWNDLVQPIHGLLVTHNLPLLWSTLIVLKFFHEMGHAYACKHYGGHVPEMGLYFILFTPCAYMDATAAWGFPQRRHRLIVSLAGMYVESLFAAAAVFVWAATESSLINALAYNVLFLASVVTVLFNINPLMHYDGYYLFSDWVEIPNLRQRAQQHTMAMIKKWFLGLQPSSSPPTRRLGWLLLGFGIASTVYRVSLLIALASILASRVFIVGAVIGVGYVGSMLVSTLRRLAHYLWYAPETAPMRGRAIAFSAVMFLVVPAAAIWVPLPTSVYAVGLVTAERETVVRAKSGGFLEGVTVEVGRPVREGDEIARLGNDVELERVARASADLQAAQIRLDAFQGVQPTRAAQQEAQVRVHAAALAQALKDLSDLRLTAPHEGRVVQSLREAEGVFLARGAPIAMIASGSARVRAILTETQLLRSAARVGERAEFRAADRPDRPWSGWIIQTAPMGSRAIEMAPLTHLGGGDIPVEPATGVATQPYFEVLVDLPDADPAELRHGMTGSLRLGAASESVAVMVSRPLLRFWHRLLHD